MNTKSKSKAKLKATESIPHQDIKPMPFSITITANGRSDTTDLQEGHLNVLASIITNDGATSQQRAVIADLLLSFARTQNPKAGMIAITPDGGIHTFTDA